MPISEKDRLAAEVEDRWVDFQDGLSNKRRNPVEQFRAFWEAGKRYAELTKNDPLIHRKVVEAINGLREFHFGCGAGGQYGPPLRPTIASIHNVNMNR